MKIIANRLALLQAAKTAAKSAADSNANIKELTGLLLEADMDNYMLRVTGTNLETYVQTHIKDVKIEEGGSAVITAPLLCEILRLMDGENVTIEVDARLTVHIKLNKVQYTIVALHPENFPKPVIPFPEDTVQVEGLPKLIRQTMFAAGDNSSKPVLQGVRLTFGKDNTWLAATDAKRLAISESDECADGNLEVVLHQRSLRVLNSVIGAGDKLFAGIVNKSFVLFKENLLFCAQVFDHPFTDVNQMLTALNKDFGCLCNAKELFNSVDTINSLTKSSSDRHVHLNIEETGLRLHTSGESGFATQLIPAEDTICTPNEGFYYFPNLMLDFLRFAKDDVEISINKQGFMMLTSGGGKYLLIPRRKPVPKEKKAAKSTKSKTTKTKKTNKEAKAA